MLFADAFFARKKKRMRHAGVFEHSAQDFFYLIISDERAEHKNFTAETQRHGEKLLKLSASLRLSFS
jgi:hypothetical protein